MMFFTRVQNSGEKKRVATGRVALVFLPGIMGARLTLISKDGEANEWNPDGMANMAVWIRLEPDEMSRALALRNRAEVMQTGPGLSADEERRGWAGVAAKFYVPFLRTLEKELGHVGLFRCQAYAIGYDWRLPTSTSGGPSTLGAKLLEIKNRDDIDRMFLITHSMGGLVARCLTRSPSMRRLIEGVIHIAQPVDGAVVAYRRFFSGAPYSMDGERIDGTMRFLLGDTPEKVAQVLHVIPAALELLPTNDYALTPEERAWFRWQETDAEGRPGQLIERFDDVHEAYVDARWPPSAVPRTAPIVVQEALRKGLNAAGKRVKALGRQMHPVTFSVYSTGVETDVALFVAGDGEAKPEVSFELGRHPVGDGTVPAMSAWALFPGQASTVAMEPDKELLRQYVVTGPAHDSICLDAEAQACVVRILKDLLTPPILFEHGEITGDGAVLTRKRMEAKTDKDVAAELRVAKMLRQRGHAVHVIDDANPPKGTLNPDLVLDETKNVDVKRPIKITTDDARELMIHGSNQVGPGGCIIIVHSEDAIESLETFRSQAVTFASDPEIAKPGLTIEVVEERALPKLGTDS